MDTNKVGLKRANIDNIIDGFPPNNDYIDTTTTTCVKGYTQLYEDNNNSNDCNIKRIKLLDTSPKRFIGVSSKQQYYSNSNSNYNNSYNNNNSNNHVYIKDCDLFDSLSVEIIVKIFGYCDPFSTPLMYICKRWHDILRVNNRSLWRELAITINDSRPYELKPLYSRVLSYFKNGYGTSLHSFQLSTSLTNNESHQQQSSPTQSLSTLINYNFRNHNLNFFTNNNNNNNNNHTSITTSSSSSPYNNNKNIGGSINNIGGGGSGYVDQYDIESQRQFLLNVTKSIGQSLSLCPNLKRIEMSLPIDNDQLYTLSINCKNVNDLCLNCFLINDTGMEQALSNFSSLQQLSLNSTSNFNYEFVKQSKPSQTISPASLYSISKLSNLKSLKFVLPPQLGNYNKSLIESGIVLDQQQQLAIEDFEQNDLDKAMLCLLKCKYLETLELVSCNITKYALEGLLEHLKYLNRLVIYRNNSLTSLSIKSDTLCHLSLSCISIIQNIHIESNSLEELYVEGCETLQKTYIDSPSLQLLSLDGLSGKLSIRQCYNLKSLTLSECSGISQRGLERLLDSLVNLEDLCIFLQQIVHLRVCSSSLKRLDIEAWSGIKSCILDCPTLQELKANESTLQTLYFKGNEPSNIELDFCDSLRNIIIDVLSCNSFSFTQDHPTIFSQSQLSDYLMQIQDDNYNNDKVMEDDDMEDVVDDFEEEDTQAHCSSSDEESDHSSRKRGRSGLSLSSSSNWKEEEECDDGDDGYMSPTSLFIQIHRSIENCTILSGNVIGKISTNDIGTLSIEQKSMQSIDLSSVSTIQRLKSYHQTKRGGSENGSGSRSPMFIPIP